MNKPALALGLACVALAALDIKLLRDLDALRTTNAAEKAGGPGASAAATDLRPEAAAESEPGFGHLPDSRAKTHDARGAGRNAVDADFMRMYSEPRTRQQVVAEQSFDRRTLLRGVDSALDIDPDRWAMLNDRLAELETGARDRYLRCAADTACPHYVVDQQASAESEQILQEVLGAAKANEFKTHLASLQERRAVDGLQARLGDSQLTRERSEELIKALHDEDRRVREEWGEGSVAPTNWFSYEGLGRVAYPGTATTAGERAAGAADYSRRLRERAATLLNAEQRAAFEALQNELLKQFEREERRRTRGS